MNLANKISIARIILIPFFVSAIVYGRMEIALALFIIAAITDGADGFIARAFNQKTDLGAILDPIADKMLLLTAFISMSLVRSIPPDIRLPPYVPIIVISRDILIVIGSVVVYMIKGGLKAKPSMVGKITTFFQMATIVSVLVLFRYSYIIWNIAVALTVISGIDYLIKGSRLLSENHIQKKAG
jgi:cardiolipin synthase (CMP-forming)